MISIWGWQLIPLTIDPWNPCQSMSKWQLWSTTDGKALRMTPVHRNTHPESAWKGRFPVLEGGTGMVIWPHLAQHADSIIFEQRPNSRMQQLPKFSELLLLQELSQLMSWHRYCGLDSANFARRILTWRILTEYLDNFKMQSISAQTRTSRTIETFANIRNIGNLEI